MKTLIAQSQTVLATSIDQMNKIMDSHLRVVYDHLGVHDVDFRHIAAKHSQYDALASEQQQRQGKGAGRADGFFPEVRSQIHEKDITMPAFPDKHENAEVFRRWWKDVAEYCERFDKFKGCSILFKKMRGYEDEVVSEPAITLLFKKIDEEDLPAGETMGWDLWIAEKDLVHAVKFVLKEKCADILARVKTGSGYELLRLLVLKFDPKMPHLRHMLLASICGLANDKCKDFKATVARIAYIERVSIDMFDQCGERPQDAVLGDILYPSLDPTSISELVHYRVGRGDQARAVRTTSYSELREYVQH